MLQLVHASKFMAKSTLDADDGLEADVQDTEADYSDIDTVEHVCQVQTKVCTKSL